MSRRLSHRFDYARALVTQHRRQGSGAINYIAAKPTTSFKAEADAGMDSFGQVSAGGFVSGPISETLTARVAVLTEQGGA